MKMLNSSTHGLCLSSRSWSTNKVTYWGHTRQVKKLFNMKVIMIGIPIIVRALGTILDNLENRMGELETWGRIKTIQTTAVLRLKVKENKDLDKYIDLDKEVKKLWNMRMTDCRCNWGPRTKKDSLIWD